MLPQAKKRLRRFQILVRGIPRLGLLVVNPKFQWFALTDRIAAVKVEADGDLQIALADATGDKPGIVVCEYRQNRIGVRYAPLFLVGRGLVFLCTFAQQENLRSIKPQSSTCLAKRFSIWATLPKINQTGEVTF
jgi:hypothetical protein